MHKVFQVLACILGVFISGCSSSSFPFFSDEPTSVKPGPLYQIDSVEMTYIIQEFTTELRHNNHINLQHAKAFYDEGIHAIQLEFISQNIIEMCEARNLIVDLTEELLTRINQSSSVGTQLSDYPFMPKNLEIYITFESYFCRYIDPYYVKWICLEDGQVTYYVFDIDDNEKRCWHSRHESYETSRRISRADEAAENQYEFQENAKHSKNVFGSQRYIPEDT